MRDIPGEIAAIRCAEDRYLERFADWSREDLLAFVYDMVTSHSTSHDLLRRRLALRGQSPDTGYAMLENRIQSLLRRTVPWNMTDEYVGDLNLLLRELLHLSHSQPAEAWRLAKKWASRMKDMVEAIQGEGWSFTLFITPFVLGLVELAGRSGEDFYSTAHFILGHHDKLHNYGVLDVVPEILIHLARDQSEAQCLERAFEERLLEAPTECLEEVYANALRHPALVQRLQ